MMDPFEATQHKLTFLDLSGIDDQEQEEVLNFLYEENASVQLPWKVPELKVKHKLEVKSQPSASSSQPEENHKLVPQQVYVNVANPIDYNSYVSTPHGYYKGAPPTPTAYPATINYSIPAQAQYVVYSNLPSNYHPAYIPNVTFTNSVAYAQTNLNVHCDNANCISEGAIYAGANDASEKRDVYGNEEERIVAHDENGNSFNDGDTEPVQKLDPEPEPVVRNEPLEESEPVRVKQPVNRSWASLFSTTKSENVQNVTNGAVVNGKSDSSANEINENECPIRRPKRSQFVDPNCYRMGEFLLNYGVDGRTISLQPRGLINKSNYCYINSILQALLACPPLYNLLSGLCEQNTSTEKQKPTPIIDGMCRFVKEFKHLPPNLRAGRRNNKNVNKEQTVFIGCDSPFEPSWIYKMLNGVKSDSFLVEGRQEDAEEFLGCLLNGLNDEMLELMKLVKSDLAVNKFETQTSDDEAEKEWQVMGPKNKGSVTRHVEFVKTPISNIFGGFLKSRIHRTGDQSTSNIQPFFALPLNIEKVKTVREALEALVSKNQLEGVTSEKTKEEVEAWQQVTLEELPVILILHLKCFDFKLNGCTKILKALEFPIDLKIDSKLLSSKTSTQKERQYKLFGVVYHDGKDATKGHYVTDAFHVGYGTWIRYDDASVKGVQEENVLKPQGTRVPYLLFYRRSDTITRSK